MIKSNLIDYLILFSAILMVSITRNIYITGAMILVLFIKNNISIYYLLLVFSPISAFTVAVDGYNFTKFLGFLYVIYFCFSSINLKKIKIPFAKYSFYFFIWLIILSIGFFMMLVMRENYIRSREVIAETLLRLFKITLAFLIYIDLSNSSKKRIGEITSHMINGVTIGLIAIALLLMIKPVYFIQGSLYRYNLLGSDPNDISCMIAALTIFPLAKLTTQKLNKIDISISLLSILFSALVVLLTISRAGVLTLIFIFSIFFIINEHKMKRFRKHFILILFLFLFISIYFGFIQKVIERFTITYGSGGLNALTGKRFEVWINGVYSVINSKYSLIGFGGTSEADVFLNYKHLGRKSVMHSAYISILTQYGLIGFIMFIQIPVFIIRELFRFIKKNLETYLVHFLLTIGLLFSGISLSFEFRELLWISIGISFGIITSFKIKKNYKEKKY